jgi:hypothetical protein
MIKLFFSSKITIYLSQATGEAFRPHKRTCSTSKHEIFLSWIWIQPTIISADRVPDLVPKLCFKNVRKLWIFKILVPVMMEMELSPFFRPACSAGSVIQNEIQILDFKPSVSV